MGVGKETRVRGGRGGGEGERERERERGGERGEMQSLGERGRQGEESRAREQDIATETRTESSKRPTGSDGQCTAARDW